MAAALLEVGVAFAAVAVAAAAAARLGVSYIPAFILVGILVGPNPPTEIAGVPVALVEGGEFVDVLAELGVVFLLFFLGLEFSVDVLLADRRRIATVGVVDLALNAPAGLLLALVFGRTPLEAAFVAGVVYISSSAIVTRTLLDTGWIANPEAEPVLGTLVFEDLVIAGYLAVLSSLLLGEGDALAALTGVGTALAFLGALAVLAWLGGRAIERVFDHRSDEVFLLQVVGATTLVAGGALTLGASEAVAAFFVGAGFSGTELVDRLEDVLVPLRDLFAAVFFLSIGLLTDVTLLPAAGALLGAAVVLTAVTKLVSGTVAGRVYGLSPARSVRTGLALVPRGEFSLVLAALAVTVGGSVGTFVPTFAVGYVLGTSLLGALLVGGADVLTPLLAARLPGGPD